MWQFQRDVAKSQHKSEMWGYHHKIYCRNIAEILCWNVLVKKF